MTAACLPNSVPTAAPRPVRVYEHDFSHLLPAETWNALHPAIRQRFARIASRPLTFYRGRMVVRRSLIGLFFAFAARMLGGPIPTARGEDVPVNVDVIHTNDGGVCWQRTFHFPRRSTTVRSLKVIDPRHGLLEVVEGGVGMTLNVLVRDGALVFESTRYFLEFGLFRLPLHDLLSPGRCTVEHIDEGNDRFRFRLAMTHPLFGQTILQDGVFSERGDL